MSCIKNKHVIEIQNFAIHISPDEFKIDEDMKIEGEGEFSEVEAELPADIPKNFWDLQTVLQHPDKLNLSKFQEIENGYQEMFKFLQVHMGSGFASTETVQIRYLAIPGLLKFQLTDTAFLHKFFVQSLNAFSFWLYLSNHSGKLGKTHLQFTPVQISGIDKIIKKIYLLMPKIGMTTSEVDSYKRFYAVLAESWFTFKANRARPLTHPDSDEWKLSKQMPVVPTRVKDHKIFKNYKDIKAQYQELYSEGLLNEYWEEFQCGLYGGSVDFLSKAGTPLDEVADLKTQIEDLKNEFEFNKSEGIDGVVYAEASSKLSLIRLTAFAGKGMYGRIPSATKNHYTDGLANWFEQCEKPGYDILLDSSIEDELAQIEFEKKIEEEKKAKAEKKKAIAEEKKNHDAEHAKREKAKELQRKEEQKKKKDVRSSSERKSKKTEHTPKAKEPKRDSKKPEKTSSRKSEKKREISFETNKTKEKRLSRKVERTSSGKTDRRKDQERRKDPERAERRKEPERRKDRGREERREERGRRENARGRRVQGRDGREQRNRDQHGDREREPRRRYNRNK